MEISGCTTQSLTVNTGQHTYHTIGNGKESSVLTCSVQHVIGVVDNLVVILHALVHVIINAVLCQLTDKTINASITNDMHRFGIAVRTHNRIDVAKNLRCHLLGHVNDIARLLILQQVLEHLCLACFESSHSVSVQCISQRTANLFHFAIEVMLIRNLVVHVQCGNHCEAYAVSFPHYLIQSRSVLVICNNAAASVAHGDITVIVQHRNLHIVADACKGTVTQIRADNAVRCIGLLNEEIEGTILTRAEHILVQLRILNSPIL